MQVYSVDDQFRCNHAALYKLTQKLHEAGWLQGIIFVSEEAFSLEYSDRAIEWLKGYCIVARISMNKENGAIAGDLAFARPAWEVATAVKKLGVVSKEERNRF